MRSSATKRWAARLGAAGAVGIALLSPSCADEESRRGGPGTSCLSTDDCVAPLECVANICGGPVGSGGQGGTTSQGGGGTSAGAGGLGAAGGAVGGAGGGGSGGGPECPGLGESVNACDDCLDTVCHDEICACGEDCMAIEACIESVCRALPEAAESDCFVYCQELYLAGRQAHIDVAVCADQDATCAAPICVGTYPEYYQACRLAVQQGSCAAEWDACTASNDCLLYRDCTTACPTLADCLECSATSDGQTGRTIYEAWELCVAYECIAESWW